MNPQIFVNLPVKDLQQAIAFFTQLGFQFNPQFTDETATCMIVSEDLDGHIWELMYMDASAVN